VSLAWYQTKDTAAPAAVQGEWYPHLTVSTDAFAASPTFEEVVVQPEPVQFGPICAGGVGCGAQRNLLDFLMVDMDGSGAVHLAYIDGSHGGSAGNSFVMYARQIAGPNLSGP
jgi:hypothetical protein